MSSLLDVSHDFVPSSVGQGFAVRRTQEVPSTHLDALRDIRHESSAPAGEMHMVASIPVALAELWLTQGFDVYREDARAIVKRLQREDLGAFITTNKQV